MTKNKGITLVALIITIIILLILAVVAITSISNSNIIKHAQNVGAAYTEADEKEKVTLAVHEAMLDGQGSINKNGITNGMNAQFSNNGWEEVSSDADTMTVKIKASQRQYKITLKTGTIEIITEENSGEGTSEIPEDFEKYIMGQDKNGRTIIGENGIINQSTFSFIDDPLTESVDETQTLGVEYLSLAANKDGSKYKYFVYVKYNNKAYKIICDITTFKSEKLEMIYEPKGTEGQTTAEGWTILYDNGTTAEAVSPTAMGKLRLGYGEETTDSATQLTEAIESYNNAINKINDYCKNELKGLPTNSGVRSVGTSSETTAKYSSDILATLNSAYNGVGAIGDTNFEQDLVRMAYWGVNNVGTSYWMASRLVDDYYNEVYFRVYFVDKNGNANNINLWAVDDSGNATGSEDSHSVRPIITINNK